MDELLHEGMFPVEVYEDSDRLACIIPTWVANPRESFELFVPEFEKNFSAAAAAFGCRPTVSHMRYFRNPKLPKERANAQRAHPFVNGAFAEWFRPGDFVYFIHIDVSARHDSTGFAMCHFDPATGMIVVDLMLWIPVPPDDELKIRENRLRVLELNQMGFNIAKVTTDQFQSLQMQQDLTDSGIECEQYSVDRNTEAYDTMKELMLQGKLDYYPYAPFIRECEELLLLGRKVDHPKNGSKDVADCVAASCKHALEEGRIDAAGGGRWV